jgi:hypothetical protein
MALAITSGLLQAAGLAGFPEGPAADGLVDPHPVPVVGDPEIEVVEEDLPHELAPTAHAGLGEDALQTLLNGQRRDSEIDPYLGRGAAPQDKLCDLPLSRRQPVDRRPGVVTPSP